MNDNVKFTEEDHKYTGNNSRNYISTTTIISKYKQPYDKNYWSTYKAIERIIIEKTSYNYFNTIKKCIGYENIIPHFLPRIVTPGLLEGTKQTILFEWEQKAQEARDKGTKFHKEKENETNGQIICKTTGLPIIIDERKDLNKLDNGVYTELVIWNEEYGIAGQADKVIIEDYIDIDDYKTSKKINKVSFKHYERGHIMMKYPIHNLMDCNLFHYTLQLSIYGWMLSKKLNKEVRLLRIYHSITDEWIIVPYIKKEVELLLNHYKSTNE